MELEKLQQRFETCYDRGDPDECWEWPGRRMPFGYGLFRARPYGYAHRWAYAFVNGEIPKGQCVLHTCDNPPCVNPGHLFLGSKRDNTLDMIAKGRKGSNGLCRANSPQAKLAPEDIPEIIERYLAGDSQGVIAAAYSVTQGTISKVIVAAGHGSPKGIHARKVTEGDVARMRSEYAAGGVTMKQLAERYGVGTSTASRIIHRKVYQGVA